MTASLAVEENISDEKEAIVILDALSNGDDPRDMLDDYRYWHSKAGRRQEAIDAFESGRPMSSDDF